MNKENDKYRNFYPYSAYVHYMFQYYNYHLLSENI